MTDEEKIELEEMKSFCKAYDDMPDGAFFALAEEMHGWDVYDWAWYAEQSEIETKLINKK